MPRKLKDCGKEDNAEDTSAVCQRTWKRHETSCANEQKSKLPEIKATILDIRPSTLNSSCYIFFIAFDKVFHEVRWPPGSSDT